MADQSELRARMASIAETKKVTDAMYMISSAKMRRAQREVQNTTPYFNALTEQISGLLRHIPQLQNRYFHAPVPVGREHACHGILLVTSDKGLAGNYNHAAIQVAEAYMARHPQTVLFIVGEYGRQYFRARNIPFETEFRYGAELPSVWEAEKICLELLDCFDSGRVDEINIIYTDYRDQNLAQSECKRLVLLPLDKSAFRPADGETTPDEPFPREFYPDADTVLDGIVPSYLTGFIYGSLVDSYCSEQEARMNAMSTAGRNADEMLSQLKRQYNTLRQAAITREITEITAGAKALRKKRGQPL